jgi:hypothetical protein
MTESVNLAPLRINHYYTKSRQEFVEKWQRPRADTGRLRDRLTLEQLERIEGRNIRDDAALIYVDALKDALRARTPRSAPR